MNTATIRQPRTALSLLSLVIAGAAATVAVAAIATDDVSSRPSQIVVAPLDENHPAAAPEIARPVPVEIPLDQSHPAAAPENARPVPVEVPLDQSHPAAAPENARPEQPAELESMPFIPYLPQLNPYVPPREQDPAPIDCLHRPLRGAPKC